MAGNKNEDGNLSFSQRVTKERVYSDIDLSLGARTATDGDVFRKTDLASVKQALKNLLLTNRFEKPYKPNYGGDLQGLLFELADEDTGEEIVERVKNAISRWEPRVAIINLRVTANPDYNSVNVYIEFRVINTGIVDILKLTLGADEICDPGFSPAPPIQEFLGNFVLGEDLNALVTEGGININFDDALGIYPLANP
tara:strand:+ start:20739 stop:21329 length:591 start_codon:yes stop_codon:yes gene_type:complete